LTNPNILAHKGIELSDIQGKLHSGTNELVIYGFAKLAKGKLGLTARNENGAILISQILAQIENTDFNTVVVITTSILNEDIVNRIKKLCEVFNKKLLILKRDFFRNILDEFESDMTMKSKDISKIYSNTNAKLKSLINKP
jgi:hypothetical protein